MTAPVRTTGRTQLVLVACAFLGPLAVAAWLYFQGGGLAPSARSNHGALLEPIVNLAEASPASRRLWLGNVLPASNWRCESG